MRGINPQLRRLLIYMLTSLLNGLYFVLTEIFGWNRSHEKIKSFDPIRTKSAVKINQSVSDSCFLANQLQTTDNRGKFEQVYRFRSTHENVHPVTAEQKDSSKNPSKKSSKEGKNAVSIIAISNYNFPSSLALLSFNIRIKWLHHNRKFSERIFSTSSIFKATCKLFGSWATLMTKSVIF